MVDGGSRDGTRRVAASRARLVESIAGRGRQLAAGAELARGQALLFLHADTRLGPGTGAALDRALDRSGVVGGCFELSLQGPTADSWRARLLAAAINLRSRILRTATGDQAIFCRREVYLRAGGFGSEELFEDVLFYRRLRRLGTVVVLKPPVRTSDRRWRADGYLRTIITHLTLRLLFLTGVAPRRLARLYGRGQ